MKKIFFLLCIAMLSLASFSQQIPQGMKYQGVARDLKGLILAEQKIVLRISLAGNNGQAWTPYYTETHKVETSPLGLFTLVVGEGTGTTGKFADIPWSSNEIWMEVSINDNSGFATISNSKLLAVPYAFHALTANALTGGGKVVPGNINDLARTGIPSNTWTTFGNTGTNPVDAALGTADAADLIIISSDVERIRVLKEGNIEVKRSMIVGANLTVDSTTDLNSTLNVDGPTDLNSTLNVNNKKATKLTGTLQVDSTTNIKGNFFVSEAKPSVLTGTLRLDSNATFKQKLILDNEALEQDTASLIPSGALQVSGGVGIGGNITIAGDARIGGGLSLSKLKVTGDTQSENDTTGALVVVGGVGIGRQVNIGGSTTINNSLTVNAGTSQVAINGGSSGAQDDASAYPLVISGKKQGIQIKLTEAATPNNTNNFITFKDQGGTTRGRIEGQTIEDLDNDPLHKWDNAEHLRNIAVATASALMSAKELFAATADIRACVGLGVCVTSPPIGVIIVKSIIFAVRVFDVAYQTNRYIDFKSSRGNLVGVVYSSSAGDYAEWLPRTFSAGKMKPGQVIGVHKGEISFNTVGADRVLVVSTNPIVLGNAPEEERKGMFEKVAFLGQVPVIVTGVVTAGDYILASNNNDGLAVAKHPEDLTIDDLSNFIGIAWTSSDKLSEKTVKVAIGISNNDLKSIVTQIEKKLAKHTDELTELRKQLNENRAMMNKIASGNKIDQLPLISITETTAAGRVSVPKNEVAQNPALNIPSVPNVAATGKVHSDILTTIAKTLPNAEGDRLPPVTDDLIAKLLEWGAAYTGEVGTGTKASGGSLNKIKADPVVKKTVYDNVKQIYQQAFEQYKQELQK
ncbi:MAG: hypothetical protein V4676_04540 [Bacteroidota bacterium]